MGSFIHSFLRSKDLMGVANLLLLFFMARLVGGTTTVYNVVDYGAVGNSKADDTRAFLKTWEAACADHRSPTVLIPEGKTFLLSKILFAGPCNSNIYVQIRGNIVAHNKLWTTEMVTWILFSNINNLMIGGSGQIDGQGSIWWACKIKNKCKVVPYSFGIMGCKDVTISGLQFKNSPGKHLTVHESVRVHIKGLKITAPGDSPNTDGMMIQESQHVEVTDSTIGTGDDCIAIGTGSSDVNISRIMCGPGHGISVGSLGASKSKANVQNIRVSNCSISNTMMGVRIKTWQGGSGFAGRISFDNIRFNSVNAPILIDQYYCGGKHNCPNSTSAVQVSDVLFMNAIGTTSGDVAISLACSKSVPCTGIVIGNVSIKPVPGLNQATSYCLNARGRKAGQVTPEVPCLS